MEVGSNNAGEKAIITLTIVEKRYVLGEKKLYKPPCYITYNKTKDTVKIKGIASEFLVTMRHSAVLPYGIYKLEMPDVPHDTNPDYFKCSVYLQTWFRIVYPGGYYFHFGSISEGCITVLTQGNPNDSWTKIYKHIVLCRDPQEAGIIGRLEVVS